MRASGTGSDFYNVISKDFKTDKRLRKKLFERQITAQLIGEPHLFNWFDPPSYRT
uniref:Uncharacterized protein n=1 Tax=Anguilla anguilla TaxID=7936 RepID=A0A0E9QUT2_ANGAN